MRITLQRSGRLPGFPVWALLVFALWVGLGYVATRLARRADPEASICLFKNVTGVPCPTCGLTRSAESVLRGDMVGAFALQPFMFTAAVVWLGAILLHVIFARRVRVLASSRTRQFLWGLLAALFVANWVYVIVCVG